MRPVIAQERVALAQLLGVHPRNFRHTLAARAFDIAHGATADITVQVPRSSSLLITHIEVEGYPKDGAGLYVESGRVDGAPFDTVTFQFLLGGVPQTTAQEYHQFKGSVFKAFGTGSLVLRVAYSSLSGANTAQRLYVTLHGYFVPNSVRGISGEQVEGLDQILSDLSQVASAPAEVS